jgi:signal transduction histidine kinase/ActR/RegA family two-component response regulator
MPVRTYILIILLTTGLVGGLIAFSLHRRYLGVNTQQFHVGGNSLVLKDLDYFEQGLDRLFVTADLVIGSSETYLIDPGKTQVDQLLTILSDLRSSELIAGQNPGLQRLEEGLSQIGELLELSVGRVPVDGRAEGDSPLVRLDRVSLELIDDFKALKSASLERAGQISEDLKREEKWLRILIAVAVVIYLGMGAGLWLWACRTVSDPIRRLDRAAQQAMVENRPFNNEEAGPTEIRGMSRSIGAFITTLEERVEERTADLSAQTIALREKIEELNRARSELARAKNAAEAASRAKSLFLANMSHEIRTPLNAVIGYCSLLDQTVLSADQQNYSQVIQTGASTLLELLSDILDISRIESGTIELEHQPFDLRQCVRDCVALVAPAAEAKRLRLNMDVQDGVPERVVGDGARVRQVILNLLNNAVKFTPSGHVSLTVSAEPQSDGTRRLWFAVRDTGIGIAEAQRSSIFDVFNQGDASMTRRFGGSGLGLAISRSLVRMMGGEISLESCLDNGSTFRFFLVAPPGDPAPGAVPETRLARADAVAEPEPFVPLNILLVEDTAINQQLAMLRLKKLGHSTDLVSDGVQALEAIREKRYDVVLMDLRLPGMDGIETARAIFKEWPSGERPRIIALTADDDAQVKQRCLEAGMDGVLCKPFDVQALGTVLKRHRGAVVPGAATHGTGWVAG